MGTAFSIYGFNKSHKKNGTAKEVNTNKVSKPAKACKGRNGNTTVTNSITNSPSTNKHSGHHCFALKAW